MKNFRQFIALLLLCLATTAALAQDPVIRPRGSRPITPGTSPTTTQPNTTNPGTRPDSSSSKFERRDFSDDSLRVSIYSLTSVRPSTFDTSISDWSQRWPIPATHIYLGNEGAATKSLLFGTPTTTGWDPGFHTLDAYRLKVENIWFYNTPKPYTELGYMLGAQQQQLIDIIHTQNIRPQWNASFRYRLFGSPGIFRNQRANHNNIQFTSWYQSPAKRYNNYVAVVNNKVQVGESGGIAVSADDLDDPLYERNRFTVPTAIGGNSYLGPNLFATSLVTGRREKDFTVFLRQQYDLGRKDSLVTDSVVTPLFYPRLRFEHTLKYATYNFLFQDVSATDQTTNNTPDSVYYRSRYGIKIPPGDSVFFRDQWREISNDFSIYQFPDPNNLQQYIKLGAELQLLSGRFDSSDQRLEQSSFANVIGHADYRNRSRNGKWDITATGSLHLAGLNFGDYRGYVSVQRLLSQNLGTLQIGAENVNRSPSFIYDTRSAFYRDTVDRSFSKENTFHFFGSYFLPKLRLQLNGDYYIVSNYLYLNGYNRLRQDNALFNLLRVSAAKTFRLTRRWNLHSDVYVQQKAGGVELNVPLLYARARLAYEGKFFNVMNLSAGLEGRYYTPYKADNYSPLLGQFFYQDTLTIRNRPDLHAFLHFRLRTFKAYIRAENLNTASIINGFGFKRHNFSAPAYPLPGLLIRVGIFWTFIN